VFKVGCYHDEVAVWAHAVGDPHEVEDPALGLVSALSRQRYQGVNV
jgi:hypothetical protein